VRVNQKYFQKSGRERIQDTLQQNPTATAKLLSLLLNFIFACSLQSLNLAFRRFIGQPEGPLEGNLALSISGIAVARETLRSRAERTHRTHLTQEQDNGKQR